MRATTETTFTDSCVINQPAADPTFDADTGGYSTDAAGAQVYSGPCAIAPTQGSDRVVLVADEPVTLRTFVLRLPWDATGLAVDQIATLTTDDPHMTGRTVRVIDVQGRTTDLERILITEDHLG